MLTFGALPALMLMLAPAPTCPHLPGTELALADISKRYVIVGERHGTSEIPSLFSDLVCAAASKGAIVVGLEIQADQQESLDDYLASEGDQSARDALLTHKHWRVADGRASEAMFQLLENLRRLRHQGAQVSVLAFMPSAGTPEAREPEAREAAMGMAWKESLGRKPNVRLLALVGSVHAEREPLGQFTPAARTLPAAETITLSYFPSNRKGIFLDVPAEFRWPRYNMWYSVGAPFTSSTMARASSQR